MIEAEINFQKIQGLSRSRMQISMRAIEHCVLLALGKAAQAHEILRSIESVQLKDTVIAFDSVADDTTWPSLRRPW